MPMVCPAVANDVLRDVRQILLQVAISGADQHETLRRTRFELSHDIDLPGDAHQWILGRLVAVRGWVSRGPLDVGL